MIDLSIIIINWNTKEALLNCLNSIANTVKGIKYELIIVDNASTDGSAEAIAQKYPSAKIIKNDYNLGFARAVNQGMNKAQGKYFLSLNSDTRVNAGALELMIKFMDENPSVGIAGAQLINEDNSLQNSFDNFPNLATVLLNKSALRLLFPSKYLNKDNQPATSFEVESVVGACMIIRPSALKDTGYFDEDYFIFLEETDLCLRMKRKGWKVMALPDAKVYHLQGETKKQILIPTKIEYLNSLYKFFHKNKSTLTYLTIRIIYPFKLLCQAVFTLISLILTLGLARRIRAKCYLYFYLLAWHLLFCPNGMTLKGIMEKAKKDTAKIDTNP